MSRKTSRLAALAATLAAVGAMSVATTSASAILLTNWEVSGSLTTTNGGTITLPASSRFNGTAALPPGALAGTFIIPSFSVSVTIPPPITIGFTVAQVGTANGTLIENPPSSGIVEVSLPTEVNIGITSL